MHEQLTAQTSPAKAAKPKPKKLSWIKYNPTEVAGMCDQLSDEEYGLFHRIIAKLWATPGNRLSLSDLKQAMRVRPGDMRDGLIDGLIGYALREDDAGLLYVPALDDAFADVVQRSATAKANADERWHGAAASKSSLRGGGTDGDF